jgi:hypothetical protein
MVKRCTSFIANDVHLSGIKMYIFYFNIFLEGFFVLDSTLLCFSKFIDAKIQNIGGNVKVFLINAYRFQNIVLGLLHCI